MKARINPRDSTVAKSTLYIIEFLKRVKEISVTGVFLRLGLLFILYPAGHFIPIWFEKVPVLASFMQNSYEWISIFIVNVSVILLKLVYPSINEAANYMIVIGGNNVLFLSPACTGLDPMLRMTFIFMFYPMAFKTKLWVLPVSMFFILVASTIHFTLLIPIAYQAGEWFRFSHDWLTKFIFYGFYFMVWVFWEKIIQHAHTASVLKAKEKTPSA